MSGQEVPAAGAHPAAQAVDPGIAALAQDLRQRAQRMALVGFLWLAGGLAVSLGSYAAADPGETYHVFWGAALFGAYKCIRGLYYVADPAKLLQQ